MCFVAVSGRATSGAPLRAAAWAGVLKKKKWLTKYDRLPWLEAGSSRSQVVALSRVGGPTLRSRTALASFIGHVDAMGQWIGGSRGPGAVAPPIT